MRNREKEINSSDASMMGPIDYGPGSYQSDRFDESYNAYYGYGAHSQVVPWAPPKNFSWNNSTRSNSFGKHFGKGPKGYQRSDSRILEDVSEALSAHPEIDASEIVVDVQKGIVTLTGSVDSKQMKRLTEDTIEAVPGVAGVRNRLGLMPPSQLPYPLI